MARFLEGVAEHDLRLSTQPGLQIHPSVGEWGRSPSDTGTGEGFPKPVPDVNLFNGKAAGTAWRTKPSWFIVANDDHTVNPDLERFEAKRIGARTYDVDSSHAPMLSRPGFVLDVIRSAANSI
jgi:pimeloyl-ACP methyl ester carboxylesterase